MVDKPATKYVRYRWFRMNGSMPACGRHSIKYISGRLLCAAHIPNGGILMAT